MGLCKFRMICKGDKLKNLPHFSSIDERALFLGVSWDLEYRVRDVTRVRSGLHPENISFDVRFYFRRVQGTPWMRLPF